MTETDNTETKDFFVKDFLGFKNKRGHVGIEIELESDIKTRFPTMPCFWIQKTEGSLRGSSTEYVTQGPILITQLPEAINLLVSTLKDNRIKIGDSPRTSLHVHCNILKYTPLQVWTFCTAYWLLEDYLTQACGESRLGNRFCLRTKDAEGIIYSSIRSVMEAQIPFNGVPDRMRYSALNLSSICKFGSLEFRSMRGTIDPDIIIPWTEGLHDFVIKSKIFDTPSDVLNFAFRYGRHELCQKVLTENFRKFLAKFYRPDEDFLDIIGRVSQFAYCTDWNIWQHNINNILKKKQKEALKTTETIGGLRQQGWRTFQMNEVVEQNAQVFVNDLLRRPRENDPT